MEITSKGINGVNIGSDDWFIWLAINKSFRYIPDQTEKFLLFPMTVRDRGDGYWYAYRKFNRKQKQKYVGKIGDIDYERLQIIAIFMSKDTVQLKLAQRLGGELYTR